MTQDLNGKEGVDGSSPSEGFQKAPQIGAFSVEGVCAISTMRVSMEPFMEPPDDDANALLLEVNFATDHRFELVGRARDGAEESRSRASFSLT
ncbi:MAG TPA: hypothetical protein VFL61_16500 [Gaiellaceae bacterium]|nr:hypothetical protein [Gaiellaceae bacterium]